MNTEQLIKEILAHPELHDLITHLGDFHEAVLEKRNSEISNRNSTLGDTDSLLDAEWEADVSYWDKQINTVEKLIDITKGY